MNDAEEIRRLEERLRELKGEPSLPEAPATPTPITPEPGPPKRADNNKFAAAVIVGGIVLFLVGIIAVGSATKTPPAALGTAGDTTVLPPTVALPAAPPVPASPWTYTRSTDPMDDSTTQRACVRSTNAAILSPPYQPLHAQLCIRRTSKWGLDVFISMEGDAQVLCNSYSGCRIPTRFDDAAATNYRGSGADDYSSNIAFIADGSASGFVEKLKTAQSIKLALTFYRDGVQVLEFETTDLQWPVPEDSAGVP